MVADQLSGFVTFLRFLQISRKPGIVLVGLSHSQAVKYSYMRASQHRIRRDHSEVGITKDS